MRELHLIQVRVYIPEFAEEIFMNCTVLRPEQEAPLHALANRRGISFDQVLEEATKALSEKWNDEQRRDTFYENQFLYP